MAMFKYNRYTKIGDYGFDIKPISREEAIALPKFTSDVFFDYDFRDLPEVFVEIVALGGDAYLKAKYQAAAHGELKNDIFWDEDRKMLVRVEYAYGDYGEDDELFDW